MGQLGFHRELAQGIVKAAADELVFHHNNLPKPVEQGFQLFGLQRLDARHVINGNFLEVVSKREAHEKGLLHKVVITEVIDSKGQWIMVKQSGQSLSRNSYFLP